MKINSVLYKLTLISCLIIIILFGAYLRITGINWDQDFHLHPDERFLTMVETSISPVSNIKEYFNTGTSSLNPHNILDANGNSVFPFFVYGTLPLFIVRYTAEWTGHTGYNQVFLLGRYLSGLFDIGTIFLVFFTARKLFSKQWLPYLAAFLYAFSVLPIQISHFFVVDNFTTFFSTLALYAAVNIWKSSPKIVQVHPYKVKPILEIFGFGGFKYFAIFATAFGMALASKINAGVIVILLPLAVILNDSKILKNSSSPKWKKLFHHMVLAGILSFLVFRIFQPYAFSGPGFFNVLPNPKWINNLRELAALSSGDSNYPPSLQWARRSFSFPIKNLVIWGLGLPAGIFAILGLLLMGWKIIQGQWEKYGLIWVFTISYLIWQATGWNPTMRYFLLIYPVLSIIAAWLLFRAIGFIKRVFQQKKVIIKKIINLAIVSFLIFGTFIWAISFVNIYRKPMTRIAASEWIYENVESAVNLSFKDQNGAFSQPLPYTHYTKLEPEESLEFSFFAEKAGTINQLMIDHIVSPVISDISQDLSIQLVRIPSNEVIYSGNINDSFQRTEDSRGRQFDIVLNEPYEVQKGDEFKVKLDLLNGDTGLNLSGYLSASIEFDGVIYDQPVFEFVKILSENSDYQVSFKPFRNGMLTGLQIFRILNLDELDTTAIITMDLIEAESGNLISSWKGTFKEYRKSDFRGSSLEINLENPVPLLLDRNYLLLLKTAGEGKFLALNGSKSAKETDWDDALPLYMHGLNPFDLNEGLYPSELNFQMYWDDNQDKLERFMGYLARTDYIIFSSNRQWGSTTQIPERYPLTTLFYKELLGCQTNDVQSCYRVAKPEIFTGNLGFELVKTFQVNPSFLSYEFNSQFAEEAFTVYDHPKVFVFRKSNKFDIGSIIEKLSSVNLNQVLNLSPKEAEQRPGNLMLSKEQSDRQKISGTWSDYFDYDSIQNKYPLLSICLWYLALTFLGWIFYPLTRIVFKGLPDRGYPFIKLTSLIIIALPIWLASSMGFTFDRLLIKGIILVAFFINLFIFIKNKLTIINELQQNYRHFIKVELLGLLFFILFLLIRLGNPDLWHPYKGGEKPMDFSFFNAVIKSVNFPPYDPWYAGGYINYYYYGFVIVAIPVKLLGIVPSIAYNLTLPTFFTFTAMGAFSLGWNLQVNRRFEQLSCSSRINAKISKIINNPYLIALISSSFVLIIGNLGTIRMFFQGIFNLGLNSLSVKSVDAIQTVHIYLNGLKQFLNGARLNYYPGDWYWIPSRAIPGESITEFPFFTFLYGDPHAHLFAIPITLLALSWSLSIILGKFKYSGILETIIQLIAGATIIGSLRATNTWDYPTYLGIAVCAIVYCGLKYLNPSEKMLGSIPVNTKRIFSTLVFSGTLILLTIVLYFPFIKWFGQGYSTIELWKGDQTPLGSFLIHWGFFLFIIYSWVIVEIYMWMASTPLSALKPYYPYRKYIGVSLTFLTILSAAGFLSGVKILLYVFPVLISLSALVFRKNSSDSERFVLFLSALGLILTLIVEFLVIRGDIGRMNTVFKFYLQAWTLLALGSAYFIPRLFYIISKTTKYPQLKRIWITGFVLLVVSVLLFTVTSIIDKVTDRISSNIPLTLDGMSFMNYSTYLENDVLMDLSQDYHAIRWLQENITGTPTLVEANVPEYRWGNRYTVYTGLPGVVGWNWHQRQQRTINPSDWVTERVDDIGKFFSQQDLEYSKKFLIKYQVDYIIVGQLEKAIYPVSGLDKFTEQNNILWSSVYSSKDTVIYKVNH